MVGNSRINSEQAFSFISRLSPICTKYTSESNTIELELGVVSQLAFKVKIRDTEMAAVPLFIIS